MAGGLMVKPAGPSTTLGMGGRVTLTPSEYSQKVARARGDQPKPPSKRANLARLAVQRRLDSVLAPQRPMLDRVGFTDYLRNGSI